MRGTLIALAAAMPLFVGSPASAVVTLNDGQMDFAAGGCCVMSFDVLPTSATYTITIKVGDLDITTQGPPGVSPWVMRRAVGITVNVPPPPPGPIQVCVTC
jgi:hypothetical protein